MDKSARLSLGFKILPFLCLFASLQVAASRVEAQVVVATIPGSVQYANKVAVNPNTNRIYVTGYGIGNTLTVIDGATNSIIAVAPIDYNPWGVAVNPNTNRIYVVNTYSDYSISAIDGDTHAVLARIPVSAVPLEVAVNAITNRIYVASSAQVSVIDGNTNAVIATVPMEAWYGIAVNPNTNRIYVTNYLQSKVSVIDGDTHNVIAVVPLTNYPMGVAVNPNTNLVYVAVPNHATIAVIDGNTNAVRTTVRLAGEPYNVAVNAATNRIYVTSPNQDRVSVLEGFGHTVLANVQVGDGPHGLEANPVTDRVYVGNIFGSTVSVIHDSADHAPSVNANGPYEVDEGGAVTVTATGTDPEGKWLSFAWDCNNDGQFETPGRTGNFSAASLDGISSHIIKVQVTDSAGHTITAQTTVNVRNVAPTATLLATPSTIVAGQSATLAFSNPLDPSAADVAAGFTYSYDCTNDGAFEASDVASAAHVCTYPVSGAFTARGRIKDKDGGFTDYMIAVLVQTPREATQDLIEQVLALNKPQGNGLIGKLNVVIDRLDHDRIDEAIKKLEDFIDQVEVFIRNETFTAEEGQSLIDAANEIIAVLQTSLPKFVQTVSPSDSRLEQNSPNPFNPVTTIQFSVPRASHARLKVYNSFGAEVATLVDDNVAAGTYKVNWDASRMASGLYLYRLEAEGFTQTKKLLLMK